MSEEVLTAEKVRRGVTRARAELLGSDGEDDRPLVDLPDAAAAAIEGGLGVLSRRAEDVARSGREALALAVRYVSLGRDDLAYLRLARRAGREGWAERLAARRGSLDAAREARRREEELLAQIVELAGDLVAAAGKAALPLLLEALGDLL